MVEQTKGELQERLRAAKGTQIGSQKSIIYSVLPRLVKDGMTRQEVSKASGLEYKLMSPLLNQMNKVGMILIKNPGKPGATYRRKVFTLSDVAKKSQKEGDISIMKALNSLTMAHADLSLKVYRMQQLQKEIDISAKASDKALTAAFKVAKS